MLKGCQDCQNPSLAGPATHLYLLMLCIQEGSKLPRSGVQGDRKKERENRSGLSHHWVLLCLCRYKADISQPGPTAQGSPDSPTGPQVTMKCRDMWWGDQYEVEIAGHGLPMWTNPSTEAGSQAYLCRYWRWIAQRGGCLLHTGHHGANFQHPVGSEPCWR